MEEVTATLEIEFALLPSFGQRRDGYRPNHKHPLTGEHFLGQVTFEHGFVDAGAIAKASVRLILRAKDYDSLIRFGCWSVWEGATHVGLIKVLSSGR